MDYNFSLSNGIVALKIYDQRVCQKSTLFNFGADSMFAVPTYIFSCSILKLISIDILRMDDWMKSD